MRASAWLPGEGFLLCLLLVGLLLLAADMGVPEERQRTANGGGWVRLVLEDRPERFVRIRPGESLPELLAREGWCSGVLLGDACSSLLLTPGTEVRVEKEWIGAGGGVTCGVSPLPEGVRYLLGMRMNVNRAAPEDLAMLPGIGEVIGRRIVEERDRRDGFTRPEDLLRVSGVGPKRLERIERHVTFGP